MQIKELLRNRPLSWSSISSFEYNPEEWYMSYVLGKRKPETKEMIFGKVLAHSIETGKPLVPVTIIYPEKIEKGKNVEHSFKVMLGDIPLIGFADTFDHLQHKHLGEFKTGKNDWDQVRVDNHGQITMYLLMNFITYKVLPDDVECFLEWIPTYESGDFKIKFVKPVKIRHFKTKRTMSDVLMFGERINKTVEAMQRYIDSKIVT